MTGPTRSARIKLPEEWLELVAREREKRGWSQEELGRRAADAIGRPAPFSNPTLSRFLRGATTYDVAEGVALALGLALPIARQPTLTHQEWCELGRRLDAVSPALFLAELHELRTLVLALERRAGARRGELSADE